MFLALGYYVTESSGHNSEYNWWFRKRPDLIEKYCTHGTGWNPGEYAYILKEYQQQRSHLEGSGEGVVRQPRRPSTLERGHEYAAYIINALHGRRDRSSSTATCPTRSLITNLPQGACVEVPVLVDKAGFHPIHVGALPAAVRLLTNVSSSGIEEMAITAASTGDPTHGLPRHLPRPADRRRALAGRDQGRWSTRCSKQNKDYLPQFKHFKI